LTPYPQRIHPSPRPSLEFCNMLVFAMRDLTQPGGPPLVGCSQLLIHHTLLYNICFLLEIYAIRTTA
jgi:hypothetical protein